MRTLLLPLILTATPALAQVGPPVPAAALPRTTPATVAAAGAPEAPVNGVVILYGNQKCPTNAAGEEVVVCARRNAAEQFRIPRELRDGTIKPEYESFALKGQAILDGGKTGGGTCDMTGVGGTAGCRLQEIHNWGRAKQAEKDAAKKAPLDQYAR